jgi:hypothetical protein
MASASPSDQINDSTKLRTRWGPLSPSARIATLGIEKQTQRAWHCQGPHRIKIFGLSRFTHPHQVGGLLAQRNRDTSTYGFQGQAGRNLGRRNIDVSKSPPRSGSFFRNEPCPRFQTLISTKKQYCREANISASPGGARFRAVQLGATT